MPRERTSLIPTLIIIAGVAAILAPAVFALAYFATQRVSWGIALTLGACVIIPALFITTIVTLGMFANRRMVRYALSRCTNCGYDLRGTDGSVCPECGTPQHIRLE